MKCVFDPKIKCAAETVISPIVEKIQAEGKQGIFVKERHMLLIGHCRNCAMLQQVRSDLSKMEKKA